MRIITLFTIITLTLVLMPIVHSTAVIISDIYDDPDPVNVENASITITAIINRVDLYEDTVLLQILSPELLNITPYKVEFIDSQRNKYYFSFDPSYV
ncbi:MAG: hypothetical protein GXN99_00845, partial [Candidatus Nanohaloarchaeota archaeon]|nr:hypothetical protein [Candidatus Nanohaloarchaeota archaeon]